MASVRRKPLTPYFFACFTGPDGRRVQRSTKTTNRKKAQAIAEQWEKAAKLAAEKRLGEAQARKVLSEIYEVANGTPLPSASARDFLTAWVERRRHDTAHRTHQAYAQVVRDFVESLGDWADRDISQVSRTQVSKFRDMVLNRTSVATANKSLKYLRVAMGAAFKEGLIQDNPAARVDVLKRRDADRSERRPFTLKELRTLIDHATGEWKGLILFGLYTGQRLKDVARLTWQNLDIEGEELKFITSKTGRRMQIPLAPALMKYLEGVKAGDKPDDPLFPDAYEIGTKETGDSRLSQQFYGILVAAGLAKARGKEATGEGRSRRRTVNEISFHSLRHTATSLLKNAGVSESVAMDLIGHDSAAISRHYTHIDDTAKRKALRQLPNLL